MSVDDVYKLVLFVINKSINGDLSPSEFNRVINAAQTQYFSLLLGELEQYPQGGPSKPRISYSQSEQARQRLTPFISPPTDTNVGDTGSVAYPSDYQGVDILYTQDFRRIRYCAQEKFYSYYNSKIDPFAQNPFYLLNQSGMKVYPNDLGKIVMYYLQTPKQIKWNFDTDANGRAVFTPTGSQDPLWYDPDVMEVVSRALRLVSVNLSAQGVAEYAAQTIQIGQ